MGDEKVEQKDKEAEEVIKTKADASKGANEIQVDNTTSFLAGDRISVDGEPCTVADIIPPTGIKLKDGLQEDHSKGSTVTKMSLAAPTPKPTEALEGQDPCAKEAEQKNKNDEEE